MPRVAGEGPTAKERRRHRLRTLLETVRTPADVSLVARMWAWSLLLRPLKHLLPLPTLARIMWSTDQREATVARPTQIAHLTRWTAGLRPGRSPGNCLERSLIAYRFLARAGASPRLVVGVKKANGKLAGHVWVTLNGDPLHESAESLSGFVRMIDFGEEGRVMEQAGEELGRAALPPPRL